MIQVAKVNVRERPQSSMTIATGLWNIRRRSQKSVARNPTYSAYKQTIITISQATSSLNECDLFAITTPDYYNY